tara:strand:+ start:646 stop:813 length:168 start_codon:yes stop_codon:yes gene_type:complete
MWIILGILIIFMCVCGYNFWSILRDLANFGELDIDDDQMTNEMWHGLHLVKGNKK